MMFTQHPTPETQNQGPFGERFGLVWSLQDSTAGVFGRHRSLQEQAPRRPVTPLAGSVGLARCPVQGLGKNSADQVKQRDSLEHTVPYT